MSALYKSKHGMVRTSQRAISDKKIEIVLQNVEPRFHKGNIIYFVKNKDLDNLKIQDDVNKQELDKLNKLVIIVNNEKGSIITAYYASYTKQKKILKLY